MSSTTDRSDPTPPPSETVNWEVDLGRLLGDLSETQDQLLDVLARKQTCMAHGDLEGMNQLQPLEESLCAQLQSCHERRLQLLDQAAQQGQTADNLSELAGALKPREKGSLGSQVNRVSSRMKLLQHQSLANWVLAQKAVLHLSQMLEIIATGGRLQPTYEKKNALHARGNLVDQEV